MHTSGIIDPTQTSAQTSPPPGDSHPSPRHGWLWRSCLTLAWTATLILLAIATLRVLYHDGNFTLTCINAFTRYVYLPIYVCLLWAAWQRKWLLVFAALAASVLHITLVAPEFLRDRRFEAPPATAATTLRILFANVRGDHPDPGAYVKELSEINPDVIIFVEYYPWWHRDAAPTNAYTAYPYGTMGGQRPGGEFGVFSKLPIENPERVFAANRMCYSFEIRIDGKPLRIFALHAPRPMHEPLMDYYGFWDIVTPQLLALSDPAVIVGDFNATPYSRVYKTLTADRLRSAHDDRGRGYATTWPNSMEPIPPIRIDQALLTPGVECVSINEGRGIGSDHKPLILDIRLR